MTRYLLFLFAACALLGLAQTPSSNDYGLALPDHKGQLKWSIDGFKVVENSAKPNGQELGVRGRDASGRVAFLGFLFLVPESAPATGSKCRDAVISEEKKANATLKALKTWELKASKDSPIALINYTTANRDGSLGYRVRGFVAAGDICGDLEFFSAKPISDDDPDLKKAFLTYYLDAEYAPQFGDIILYAEVLFRHHDYRAAAPIFEKALTVVPVDGAPFKSATIARRVARDQAGMSYGISGNFAKARTMFEQGVREDPEYPMYYYNLACADAGEKKLGDARVHLQQAFDRKANVNVGESMPVPTEDDSFIPYKDNKEFWTFLVRLQAIK